MRKHRIAINKALSDMTDDDASVLEKQVSSIMFDVLKNTDGNYGVSNACGDLCKAIKRMIKKYGDNCGQLKYDNAKLLILKALSIKDNE